MYPFLRTGKELWRIRSLPPIGFFDKHETKIRVYPWDIDIFLELNNGRTLTLYDIPRVGLALRCGLWDILKRRKLKLTVAGLSVQYRKRITNFQTISMSAQCIGLDEKFIYLLQNCSRDGTACGQVLLRSALVKDGIISPLDVLKEELGEDVDIPVLPGWVNAYIDAANQRPWPPMEE